MARTSEENGFSEVSEAWRHSAQKISADLNRTARDAREAAQELSEAVRHSAEGIAESAATRTRETVDTVQTNVRRLPVDWLAGAAGIGTLIGLVLASGSRRR
jgi:ElaB/YqjD/DUF883 family membrane-anchored ribosome-binding protein